MSRRHSSPLYLVATLILLILFPALAVAQDPPQQPTQPATGPGGGEYAYLSVLGQHYGPDPDGTAAPTGYWLFEPTSDGDGTPVSGVALPVVLFLHGFGAVDPELYRAWIDHLVRRGAIVVYPDYHATDIEISLETIGPVGRASPPHVRAAMHAALAELAHGDHARPDLGRVAAVGHSLGAVLAADYASIAAAEGLPVPTALMVAIPGCPGCDFTNLPGVPAATRTLVVVADQDVLFGEDTAKHVWAGLTAVPSDRRDYIRLRSDAHGEPAIVADHFVALTAGFAEAYVDALDWYGTWKLFDALMACAFDGEWCDYALGDTPEQRFMSTWSDGVPVIEAQVDDDPGPPGTPTT